MSPAMALAFVGAALGTAGGVLLVGAAPLGRNRDRSRDGERPRLLRLLIRAGRSLRAAGGGTPLGLEARIAAAGRPGGLGARELTAAKGAAAVAGALFSVPLATAAPGRLGFAVVVAAPAAGFLAPDLWLSRRARERSHRMRRDLPALLDLLRLSVEAGRSLPVALGETGAHTRGPLAAEWRTVAREVTLGVPLDAALRGLVERAPLAEVRSLVAALERARRHGSPLADTLAAQARDARFSLARAAREEAARAGPKIQLVVALLLVPSVLLLVAAALAAALVGDGAAGQSLLPI